MQSKYLINLLLLLVPSLSGVVHVSNYLNLCFTRRAFNIDKIFIALFKFIKKSSFFRLSTLVDIIAYDVPTNQRRFSLIYSLLSVEYNYRIFLTFKLNETHIISLSQVYLNSNWSEREVRDMFGILFIGNTDLRRLLTDYGFVGYPLRKDFPLTGYTEVRYDDVLQTIVYEPVQLSQEYRVFSLNSPWERVSI